MKVITIGRSQENDIVISDPLISRNHLQIIQNDNGFCSVVDLGSVNGTYVNGKKISGEVRLQPNDTIRVGNTNLPWLEYLTDTLDKNPVISNQSANLVTGKRVKPVKLLIWVGLGVFVVVAGCLGFYFYNSNSPTKSSEELVSAGVNVGSETIVSDTLTETQKTVALEMALISADSLITVARNQQISSDSQLEKTKSTLKSSQNELDKKNQELDETKGQLTTKNQELDETRGQLTTKNQELDETKGQLTTMSQELDETKSALDEIGDKNNALQSRIIEDSLNTVFYKALVLQPNNDTVKSICKRYKEQINKIDDKLYDDSVKGSDEKKTLVNIFNRVSYKEKKDIINKLNQCLDAELQKQQKKQQKQQKK